eukprot:10845858-Lingulodinium_polyedra.AAC.1
MQCKMLFLRARRAWREVHAVPLSGAGRWHFRDARGRQQPASAASASQLPVAAEVCCCCSGRFSTTSR